jgi:hypothetical protein
MVEFLQAAEQEIDRLIAADDDWFAKLPYGGAMDPKEARGFEIEKRAMWRRVIYDADRSDLPALRWSTRNDDLVCPRCREFEGRVFARSEFDDLAALQMHLGCRCELIPERA